MAILDNPGARIGVAILVGGILIALIISVLPYTSLPVDLETALDWLFETLWGFDFMFPVLTAMNALILVISLDIIFATVKLILFFKKHLTKAH